MTPKEKAAELYNKFFDYADSNYGTSKFNKNWFGNVLAGERKVRKKSAKECALIAVNEILEEIDDNYDTLHSAYRKKYYIEVKQEIENYNKNKCFSCGNEKGNYALYCEFCRQ